MSKETELSFKIANIIADQFEKGFCDYRMVEHFAEAIEKELLAQPEQNEQNEQDLREDLREEPVAWITEWVQRYRHNDTPIIDRAVSFTKGGAPAVPNPNYIPLYLAPPKRKGLSDSVIDDYLEHYKGNKLAFWDGALWAEDMHGITGVDK